MHVSLVTRVSKKAISHHETCLAVSSVSPKRSMITSPPLGLLYIIVGGEGATNFPRDELHIGFKKQLIELLGLSCAWWEIILKSQSAPHHMDRHPTKISEKKHQQFFYNTGSLARSLSELFPNMGFQLLVSSLYSSMIKRNLIPRAVCFWRIGSETIFCPKRILLR